MRNYGRRQGPAVATRSRSRGLEEELLREFKTVEQARREQQLPAERNGRPPKKRVRTEEETFEVSANERTVRLPANRPITGFHLKQMLDIYEGMELFMRNGHGWQRVRDHQTIDLDKASEMEARPKKVRKVQPRHVPRFRID